MRLNQEKLIPKWKSNNNTSNKTKKVTTHNDDRQKMVFLCPEIMERDETSLKFLTWAIAQYFTHVCNCKRYCF